MPTARAAGIELHWERHGSGDPVLLIQGLGANLRFWAPLVPLFAEHSEVVLADWPGTGLSGDIADETAVSTSLLAEALAALLDEIGVEQVHVVGRSMGGCIAQQLAIHHPQKVRSLVLASTWARADEFLAALLRSWGDILERGGDQLLLSQASFWAFPREFYSSDHRRQENEVAAVISNAIELKQRPAQFRRLIEAGVEHDSVAELHKITVPTTVMVGAEDILTPPSFALTLFQLIPGARLEMIPGAGHGFYEQLPDKFVDHVFATWARVAD